MFQCISPRSSVIQVATAVREVLYSLQALLRCQHPRRPPFPQATLSASQRSPNRVRRAPGIGAGALRGAMPLRLRRLLRLLLLLRPLPAIRRRALVAVVA